MNPPAGNGDPGTTRLAGGHQVSKDALRIEAGGTLDELNAHLGMLAAASAPLDETLAYHIRRIQSVLFHIGALVATTAGSDARKKLKPFSLDSLAWIDESRERVRSALPELKTFILPGGHHAAAQAQVCRTVCRRAERRLVSLAREEQDPAVIECQAWLNRLANYLFECARWCNHQAGTDETIPRGTG